MDGILPRAKSIFAVTRQAPNPKTKFHFAALPALRPAFLASLSSSACARDPGSRFLRVDRSDLRGSRCLIDYEGLHGNMYSGLWDAAPGYFSNSLFWLGLLAAKSVEHTARDCTERHRATQVGT